MTAPPPASGTQFLKGKIALVTGAGSGIGLGVAQALGAAGAAVVLTGRSAEKLAKAAAGLRQSGSLAHPVAGDVRCQADCQRMVQIAAERFGSLHILVNNAGVAAFGRLEETADQHLESIVDTNLKGPLYLCKAALPLLRQHQNSGGASIVNISSSVTTIAVPNFSVYSASKAALNTLTRCLALDHGPEQIRVNAVLPGVVETPIFETMMPPAAVQAALKDFAAKHPLGRIGRPEDIAQAVLFLVSPAASWITGALLPVDGGIGLA